MYLFRTFIIFIVIAFIIRILGKREVGQLSLFDLVVILLIANIGSMGIEIKEVFLKSILCLFVLVVLQKASSILLLKFSKLRIIDGKPRIIIMNGTINYDNMRKERYTIDDLLLQIRDKGIMCIKDIRLAILETNGNLSVFDMKNDEKVILPIIKSGKLIKENIEALNLSSIKYDNLDYKNILLAFSDGTNVFIEKVKKKKR